MLYFALMSAMLHLIHKITVSLFVLSYLIRLIGLLGNIQAINNLYSKKIIRILVDMIISTLFLVTGVWMMLNIPGSVVPTTLIVKIIIVFVSIPIAIVGFKKGNKMLAVLATVLIIGAYGLGEMNKRNPVVKEMVGNAVGAKELYVAGNCNACHGEKGNEPNVAVGAKDLTQSTLTLEQITDRIAKGKNSMPGYKKKMTEAQINELAAYVMSLRPTATP